MAAYFVLSCATGALLLIYILVAIWRKQFKEAMVWLPLGVLHNALFFALWGNEIDPGFRHLFVKTGESTSSLSLEPLAACAASAALFGLLTLWRKGRSRSIGFLFGSWVTGPFCLLFAFFMALASIPAVRY